MKILKLHGHRSNNGGIVNFQNSLGAFDTRSQNDYSHFRTGKIQNSAVHSNLIVRVIDQLVSYLVFPFYLLLTRPDVIEVNSSLVPSAFERDYWYAKIASIFLPSARLVLFNHGWNYEFKQRILGSSKGKVLRYFNCFDAIIVLTEGFKAEVKALGVRRQVEVITTGIDVSKFSDYRIKPAEMSSIRILFLSRIEKEKGAEELVDAVPDLVSKFPGIKVAIAGTGSYEEVIKSHPNVRKYRHIVSFPGYVRGAEKLQLFADSDIYVFPSSYGEGCPVSVLEALAVGLPIVYTPVGALPDILKDGVNGILIDAPSPVALSRAILSLAKNPELRNRIADNNRDLSRRFELGLIHKKLEQIYTNNG